MPTITKIVDIDLDQEDIDEILEEYGEDDTSSEVAAVFLDALEDRGVVMPLTPFIRSQLLCGSQPLRSVLV